MSFFRALFALTLSHERLVLCGFLFVFFTCSLIILSSKIAVVDVQRETSLVQQLADLQTELTKLDASNKEREKEVLLLNQYLSTLLADPLTADAKIRINLKTFLHNMTSLKPVKINHSDSAPPLRLPSGYDFLPHLLQNQSGISPSYILSKGRRGVSVALGIPTVKRQTEIYVIATLQNLLDAMSQEEKNDCIIIVFIAETNEEYIVQIVNAIKQDFKSHLDSGLIEVISPAPSYYPDLSKLKINLGDSAKRVRWRSKQNLDYAYLMMYSQPKSVFYVQLEDDIVVKPNFVTIMKTKAQEKTDRDEPWFVLDFCQLGFIEDAGGMHSTSDWIRLTSFISEVKCIFSSIRKLFRSIDLPQIVQYLLMFHSAKPVDWLLDDFIFAKVCRLGSSASTDCRRAKYELWVSYKTSLFQHVGIQSSLKGKVQSLKDEHFGRVPLYFSHRNPDAVLTSEIKSFKNYTLERAYAGESFFWGVIPEAGNHINISFKFKEPLFIERFLFRSGNAEHPSDKFYNTTVEVLPMNPRSKAEKMTEDGFIIVGEFNSRGIAGGSVARQYGAIKELRLNIHSAKLDNWAILSEIHIQPEV